MRELDSRADDYEELNRIESTEPDPDAAVRRGSRERRNAEIGTGHNTE